MKEETYLEGWEPELRYKSEHIDREGITCARYILANESTVEVGSDKTTQPGPNACETDSKDEVDMSPPLAKNETSGKASEHKHHRIT